MNVNFSIEMQWRHLLEGSAEECACFGLLSIKNNTVAMAEGFDGFINCSRQGPLVSGYPLAEWLAWNWWRLTVEPRYDHPSNDWAFAHRLSTVGEGYLWPNITVYSDRERTVVIANPTCPQGFAAFRFTAKHTVVLPSRIFEAAVDSFMGQVQGKLREGNISETNFDRIWADVCDERADPNLSARRRLEALLGIDPDQGNPEQIEQLLMDASIVGTDAVHELAAAQISGNHVTTASEIRDLARKLGSETKLGDRVRLTIDDLPPCEELPAWKRGYLVANKLREQQRLGNNPITNNQLSELCGVSEEIINPKSSNQNIGLSFSLESENDGVCRTVLRSRWETNRRFDLARLLGDYLSSGLSEPLSLASKSYTYRQKLQRAFAAELLCPFEALDENLNGDYSSEAIDDAAHHFQVSERTVSTLLVNHKRIDRDFLEDEAA